MTYVRRFGLLQLLTPVPLVGLPHGPGVGVLGADFRLDGRSSGSRVELIDTEFPTCVVCLMTIEDVAGKFLKEIS